ncbi:MAG: inositol monophosphatase [Lachnospiraceae bacterium]|nr:inositol monophosphatase [Lachnospiraceae bacterium]
MIEDLEKEVREKISPVIRECGKLMLAAKEENISSSTEEKGSRHNLVTKYDKLIQEKLKNKLSEIMPSALFLGEENEKQPDIRNGYAFIVDPIDGTSNFIKGLDTSCISIGMTYDAVPVCGIIYNPYKDELFTAAEGKGAYLNGKQIHVNNDAIEDGLVAFGTAPYNPELSEKMFSMIKSYFGRCLDIRRFGSAALDLCDLAAGRTCLYIEPLVAPWDVCAGTIIVREAGGTVTDLDGNELQFLTKTSIKASNGVA